MDFKWRKGKKAPKNIDSYLIKWSGNCVYLKLIKVDGEKIYISCEKKDFEK